MPCNCCGENICEDCDGCQCTQGCVCWDGVGEDPGDDEMQCEVDMDVRGLGGSY